MSAVEAMLAYARKRMKQRMNGPIEKHAHETANANPSGRPTAEASISACDEASGPVGLAPSERVYGGYTIEQWKGTGRMVLARRAGMPDWERAVRDLITDLENTRLDLAEAETWIPVSERLPDAEGRFAILYSHAGKARLTAFIGDFDPIGGWRSGLRDEHITHWMPLPEPPNSESEIRND